MKKSRDKAPRERDAVFHPEFLEDLRFWIETDRKVALRAMDLIEAVMKDPWTGIGEPEPLKYWLAGSCSRRLTQEHRIVYMVSNDRIDFCKPGIITEACPSKKPGQWSALARKRKELEPLRK